MVTPDIISISILTILVRCHDLFPDIESDGKIKQAEHAFNEEQADISWRMVAVCEQARNLVDMKAAQELQKQENEWLNAEKAKEE